MPGEGGTFGTFGVIGTDFASTKKLSGTLGKITLAEQLRAIPQDETSVAVRQIKKRCREACESGHDYISLYGTLPLHVQELLVAEGLVFAYKPDQIPNIHISWAEKK